MNTLAEIQDAVSRLRGDEKKVLSLWLNSQTEPEMTAQEEEKILRSLDEAIRDLDNGQGVPIEDARKRVSAWAAK